MLVDVNGWRPDRPYDGVIANQALHHLVELERLFDAISTALQPHGRFVASDMIGRNGHQRWPEARAVVDEFWAELPDEYTYNLQLDRRERTFQDWDCSVDSFEAVRSQDILPALIDRFDFELFVGFANVIDPFVDRSFGPHFDPDRSWDRDFIDRVHARDEQEMLSGHLTPTHMFAVMRKPPFEGETRHRGRLTPAACIRLP
jgi:SAM-dependent methyltransferase